LKKEQLSDERNSSSTMVANEHFSHHTQTLATLATSMITQFQLLKDVHWLKNASPAFDEQT
jgi:hypothetical protein